MRKDPSQIDPVVVNPDGGEIVVAFSDKAIKTLRLLMITLAIAMAVAVTYGVLNGHTENIVFSLICCAVILFICYREIKYKRVERGLSVFCWGVWTFACVNSFMIAGLRTPVLVILPSAITIIAWSRGKWPMLAMTILSIVVLLFDVLAENNHWLPMSVPRTPYNFLITYLAVVAISGTISSVVADNFKQLISNGRQLAADLQRRLKDLKIADEALRALNAQLEQRVVARTALLEQANITLQSSVAKLEMTQKELIQSEKLASLGSMVAGISHELNTPVGNALTLTTSLENLFRQFQEHINSGHVKKSELNELINSGRDMSILATKSTKRAVDLVSSFKKVAVDQTSEQRRQFKLFEVVDDNLATLIPSIKAQHKTIQIENRVDTQITCDSYPGPLGQIIVNLIQNAIVHGFEGRDSGVIVLNAQLKGEHVLLTVTDDGIGMTPTVLVHVFDPFFTTKLGKGGSGIGLSISYRIAKSILGGTLGVVSEYGKGASFTLTLPKNAPFNFGHDEELIEKNQ